TDVGGVLLFQSTLAAPAVNKRAVQVDESFPTVWVLASDAGKQGRPGFSCLLNMINVALCHKNVRCFPLSSHIIEGYLRRGEKKLAIFAGTLPISCCCIAG